MSDFAVSITGASGAVYGVRLVQALAAAGHGVHLVVSEGGARVLRHECGISVDPKRPDPAQLAPGYEARVTPHALANYGATIASGSFPLDGMAICPCSMGTLGRVAQGSAENLVTRAADVCLKERRRLVLVPRETPISALHLENMLRLARAGATILPAAPGFYMEGGAQRVDDLVDFVVARVMESLGIAQDLTEPWSG
jgi:4-hydroxy-3-polyprenylbenzoate decarboxylase